MLIQVDNQRGVAAMFKALGDPTRLRIFEFLRSCSGPVAVEETGEVRPVRGATVGEICCCITGVEKSSSAVSFHLKELRMAGLIEVARQGKHLVCSVNEEAVRRLGGYFASTGGCCE